MYLVKTISTRFNKAKSLIVKAYKNGKSDVQEVNSSSSFGFDSNPIKDMVGVYANTSVKGESVLIGYINKDCITDVGESRMFSTNASGEVQIALHLKNDGTAEFGGNSDFMVRYSELKSGFDQLKSDFNSLITIFNAHIHPTPSGPSSPTATLGSSSAADISGAKISEIKTS